MLSDDTFQKLNIIDPILKDYFSKLDKFRKYYYPDKTIIQTLELVSDPKIEHRYFCIRYLNNIRLKTLPQTYLNKKYEAVIIEAREFPHIEFLLRNAINKLGSEWSYTIYCGKQNINFMNKIVKKIDREIKTIVGDFDNLDQSSYSELLSSKFFWNSFVGEKILVYQEDTQIYDSNINDFLHYDYIGAPWIPKQNDNKKCVGNGGLSLRTKNVMLEVIDTISREKTKYNDSTLAYMKNCGDISPPEDVYFSKNIIDINLGLVADFDIAKKFSVETVYFENPFGGHNSWIALKDGYWKELLYRKCLCMYKYENSGLLKDSKVLYHRGGWSSILNFLLQNDIIKIEERFPFKNGIIFDDLVERNLLWGDKQKKNTSDWVGIIHQLPLSDKYNFINENNCLKTLFNSEYEKSKDFKTMLKKNKKIFVLSKNLKNRLENECKYCNLNIDIENTIHPIILDNFELFNLDTFINSTKKNIMLGQQYRDIQFFYSLRINNKYWMPGGNSDKKIMLKELHYKYNNIVNDIVSEKNVKIINFNTEKYDIEICRNNIIIPLLDASANNAVIECIVRNIPFHVNRINAIEEYVGSEYPLFYNNEEELIQNLNDLNKIQTAHYYLESKNTENLEYLSIKKFVNSIWLNNFTK